MKKYTFFDDPLMASESASENRVLIDASFHAPPQDVEFDQTIAQSNEPLGYRIFAWLSENQIDDYDYQVITARPEQYNGIIADHKILCWNSEKKLAEPFQSDMAQLVQKGYAILPPGEKILAGKITRKKMEDLREESTAEEVRAVAEQEIQEMNSYLSSTDWYAVRKIETGKEIPADISEKRASYRARISSLRRLVALAEENAYLEKIQ